MDRCAVLVDAGYLLGAAATMVAGNANRAMITVDYQSLIPALIQEAECQTGLPVLRLLWYDGARESQPTPEQRKIRVIADVKLRLGELIEREGRVQQKGVDSYLQRDLTTLARNRSVADVVLVGGDEDLRRGLEEAQDYGLRVHLWGVEAAATVYNQSPGLIAEADRRWLLSAAWLGHFIQKAEEPEELLVEAEQAAGTAGPLVPAETIQRAATSMRATPADVARLVQRRVSGGGTVAQDAEGIPRLDAITSKRQSWQDREEDAAAGLGNPFDIGVTFGRRWASRATPDQCSLVLSKWSTIPTILDGELLQFAISLGVDTWGDETAKFSVWGGFWEGVRNAAAEENSGQ